MGKKMLSEQHVYFMEVVVFFRFHDATHQGKPLEVLAWSEAHSQEIYLAVVSSITGLRKLHAGGFALIYPRLLVISSSRFPRI